MRKAIAILLLSLIYANYLFGQISKVSYRGWNDCYLLSNKCAEVIITASCGGRVLSFRLDGINILFEDSTKNGMELSDWTGPLDDPDAGRFDYGPERDTEKIHGLTWCGNWTAEIVNDYCIRLTSVADSILGLISEREFSLHPDSAVLKINMSATNISSNTIKRHFWGRTLVKSGGTISIPIHPKSSFELGWGRFLWKPDRIETTGITDQRIEILDSLFTFKTRDSVFKAGTDAISGWMSYTFIDLLFIKRFPVFPVEDYSGSKGMTSIFYSNGKFAELEPCSPTYSIQPGESVSFYEEWELSKLKNTNNPTLK